MLLLAGIMGMAVVGATVFVGFDGAEEAEADLPDLSNDDTSSTDMLPAESFAPLSVSSLGVIEAGDDSDETMSGTEGSDQLNGYQGDDTLSGAAGDDALYGASGADDLFGGVGSDTLHGDAGDDELFAQEGDDSLFGHQDEDSMDGGEGDDTLHGGEGNDDLFGAAGDDALHGGLGDDSLTGGAGQDTLFGGVGDDVLDGRDDAQDFLNGGSGADQIIAGGGDVVTAGLGDDSIVLGDWLHPGDEVFVQDFAPEDDSLIVVYEGDDTPELTLLSDALDDDVTHILLDGALVAAINSQTPVTLDDIFIMAHADAANLFAH